MDRCTDAHSDGRTNGQTDGKIDGWMNNWMNGRADGGTDEKNGGNGGDLSWIKWGDNDVNHRGKWKTGKK